MILLIIWTDTGQDLFLIVMGWKQSWGVAVPRERMLVWLVHMKAGDRHFCSQKRWLADSRLGKAWSKSSHCDALFPLNQSYPQPTSILVCISAKSVPFLVRLERISPDIKWPVFLAAKVPTRNQNTYLSLKIEINGIWVTLYIDIHNLMRGWSNPKVKMLITIHCGTVRPSATQESSRPTT